MENFERVILDLLRKAAHLWYYNRKEDTISYTVGKVKVTLEVVK